MRWLVGIVGILAIAYVAVRQSLTIFVVQPIGAVPDGVTSVIWRTDRLQFVDSADAICAREMGGVSLLCRGMVLGAVVEKNELLMKLPYSETLYLMSTDGATYEHR